jgi:hypothetical protein
MVNNPPLGISAPGDGSKVLVVEAQSESTHRWGNLRRACRSEDVTKKTLNYKKLIEFRKKIYQVIAPTFLFGYNSAIIKNEPPPPVTQQVT